jgi:ABC-type multidrug transport system fused ATPase/permease subunit
MAGMHYSAFALGNLYRDLKEVEHTGRPRFETPLIKEPGATTFQSLTLTNVRFSYPNTKTPAIDGITLRVQRGQSIGFIGESGGGKTTLIDILLGLHTFNSGRFEVNRIPIDEYGWERWLAQIAYIPQSAFLLDDTLARNVAFGVPREKIDYRRLESSLTDAQLSALVQRLPDGVQTVLGERGVRLSGGERQRVALARAFYHNRDVFVFDEATSALDGDTERQIIDVMESLHGEKTLLVVAHRMTTVQTCDVVYRLHLGKISMSGPFKEVCSEEVG